MDNVIAIYDGYDVNYDENSIETGLGGSESWVVYISEALAKIPNTHIIIYCNCNVWHFHKNYYNIEYLPHEYFYNRSRYQKYDAIIISRIIDLNIIDCIEKTNCCNNISIISHDICIKYYDDENTYILNYEILKNNKWLADNIKTIFCLSKWHKNFLINEYGFSEDLIEITKYGLNKDLIHVNNNYERDNNIFWTNRIERNFNILVEYIAPLIIKEIPDFKIYCAFYDKIPDEYQYLLKYDYVINLGKLGKQQLYEEMSKHKCYFYPLLFPETFCMTCIEHAMCDAKLIMPLRYGPETIYEPYKGIFIDNLTFDNENDFKYIAHEIIQSLTMYNDDHEVKFRKAIKNYLISNFNWNVIAKKIYKKIIYE